MLRNSAGKVSADMTASPYSAPRAVTTRRSLWSMLLSGTLLAMRVSCLDPVQPVAADVSDEFPVARERREHLAGQGGRFAEKSVGTFRVTGTLRHGAGLGA